MPRRTLLLMFIATIVALACHARADRQPYGQYLSEILGIIDQNYVEPVDEEKLFEGAVEGMVGQLDEHSSFITREDLAELRESLDQEFGGIGIEVTLDPKTKALTVLSPLVGTPAYQAGIRPGDQILAVDGQSTAGFSLQDAVKKLRGREGEKVKLTIGRGTERKSFDVELVRAQIPVESVRGDSRRSDGSWNFVLAGHPQIGYIRIINFGERTAEEVAAACTSLAQQNIKGLVLDLRENPGGLLNAAVGVCQLFIPPGSLIVTTRGRNGVIDEAFTAEDTGQRFTWPMCVLVDRFSASASEIVAACLQDSHRAIIVGERSYGKGTVQKVHEVEGGKGVLKLTTASYWRPSGSNIHRLATSKETDEWGVKPNQGFDVKLADKELIKWHELRRLRDIQPGGGADHRPEFLSIKPEDADKLDPQMQKAVESLEARFETARPATKAVEPSAK
jgi:carboxyl-terminal processing protease